MEKLRLRIGGATVVMNADAAIEVFKALGNADPERLDYDYKPKEQTGTGKSEYLYYLYPAGDSIALETVSDTDYAIWKLYTSTRGETK